MQIIFVKSGANSAKVQSAKTGTKGTKSVKAGAKGTKARARA